MGRQIYFFSHLIAIPARMCLLTFITFVFTFDEILQLLVARVFYISYGSQVVPRQPFHSTSNWMVFSYNRRPTILLTSHSVPDLIRWSCQRTCNQNRIVWARESCEALPTSISNTTCAHTANCVHATYTCEPWHDRLRRGAGVPRDKPCPCGAMLTGRPAP